MINIRHVRQGLFVIAYFVNDEGTIFVGAGLTERSAERRLHKRAMQLLIDEIKSWPPGI